MCYRINFYTPTALRGWSPPWGWMNLYDLPGGVPCTVANLNKFAWVRYWDTFHAELDYVTLPPERLRHTLWWNNHYWPANIDWDKAWTWYVIVGAQGPSFLPQWRRSPGTDQLRLHKFIDPGSGRGYGPVVEYVDVYDDRDVGYLMGKGINAMMETSLWLADWPPENP